MKYSFVFLILLICWQVRADYPSAKLNQNVCNEIQGQQDRLIPQNQFYCVAVDGNIFMRALGLEDFYHGLGHWTQIRTEVSPNEFFKINVRSVIYSGSSSEGYASPGGYYNLFSFKGTYPEQLLGGTLSARIVDLDRQTVGAGLFVEDKESIGGILLWDFESSDLMIRHDSTGMFLSNDDVWNLQARFINKLVGVGYFYFNTAGQGGVNYTRKPYHYLFSSVPIDEWTVDSEIGSRNQKWAGLIRVQYQKDISDLRINASVQARSYDNAFGDELTGQIENQYVSYDQYDKAYANSMNAFVKDDHLQMYSGALNLKYKWNHYHRYAILNEFVRFDYRDIKPENRHFYRVEYLYVPLASREDSITFFISNKVLNDSYSRPPSDQAKTFQPLFKEFSFAGMEGNYRF